MSIERVDKFDLMKLTNGLEQEIMDFKDNLSEFELAYATDTGNLFIKDEQGSLAGFLPMNNPKINGKPVITTESYPGIIFHNNTAPVEQQRMYIEFDQSGNLNFMIRNSDGSTSLSKKTIKPGVLGTSEQAIFDTENCPVQANPTGWTRFANGLIIQWGWATILPSTHNITVTFPVSFKSTYNIIAIDVGANTAFITPKMVSKDDMAHCIINNKDTWVSEGRVLEWIAIGY